MAKYAGVDLSYAQANVDYKALAKAKIQGKPLKFAMLRLGHGRTKDKLFDEHYKGCKAAGIKVGVYFWSYATTSAEARVEANWVLEQLRNYEIDYPVAMDFEDENVLAAGLLRNDYTNIVRAFLSTIKRGGYYPVLYTGKYILEHNLSGEILSEYDLWLAQYTKEGWQAQLGQTMWQFTVAGHPQWDYARQGGVDGVKGQCDCNWSYVGYAAKIKRLGLNKPKTYYKLTCEKTVEKLELAKIQAQLRAMGFNVSTKEE